jgi:hypothetical protein
MSGSWKIIVCLLAFVVVGLMVAFHPGQSVAQKEVAAGHYTVVATDGTHLIVTDNKANKVYFYAIDQGGKPGDDLKLRGTLNLEDVGKPTIKPTTTK